MLMMSACSIFILMLVLACSASAWPRRRRDVLENAADTSEGVLSHLLHFGQDLYRPPDNETGLKVAKWHEGLDHNPEELGIYPEGDIRVTSTVARNGLKAQSARWPHGVIPYVISPDFDWEQQSIIYSAMDDFHKYTCIKFVPCTGFESDYIVITADNTGCWSSVGRVGGPQDVNLQIPGCLIRKGTVIHELMHVVGFLHEHSRYERDHFVSILTDNVLDRHTHNFGKATKATTDAFGVGYDYGSVMHYSANAFSKNGQPTIVPRVNYRVKLGQRNGFSNRDIEKIQRMYRCNERRPVRFED